jgi:hypothetical protein
MARSTITDDDVTSLNTYQQGSQQKVVRLAGTSNRALAARLMSLPHFGQLGFMTLFPARAQSALWSNVSQTISNLALSGMFKLRAIMPSRLSV